MIQLMNNGRTPMPCWTGSSESAGVTKEEPQRPQINSEVDRGAPFVRSFQEFKDLLGCSDL